MKFNSEKDRESYINFLSTEIACDEHNKIEMEKLAGSMKNKTQEKRRETNIKRLVASMTKSTKLVKEAVLSPLTEAIEPMKHLAKHGYNYEVFKEVV